MTATLKLTPASCPFCGGPPDVMPWHGGGPRKRFVHCRNDYCPVQPGVTGSTRTRAVEAWNTRFAVERDNLKAINAKLLTALKNVLAMFDYEGDIAEAPDAAGNLDDARALIAGEDRA